MSKLAESESKQSYLERFNGRGQIAGMRLHQKNVFLPGILQILSFGLKSSHTIDVIHSNWSTVPGPFCWSTSSVIFAGSPNVNLEMIFVL